MTRRVPRGLRLNNPGNIEFQDKQRKFSPFEGVAQVQPDIRFVAFNTLEDGLRAMAVTLITYQEKRKAKDGSRIDTIAEFIERWAPAIENDVRAYKGRVERLVDVGDNGVVDVRDSDEMRQLLAAITRHEQGLRDDDPLPYDEDTCNRAMQRAGLRIKPKQLRRSRTIATAAAGTAATTATASLLDNADAVLPYVPLLETLVHYAPWAIAAIAVAGFAYVAYCRYDDHRKAER